MKGLQLKKVQKKNIFQEEEEEENSHLRDLQRQQTLVKQKTINTIQDAQEQDSDIFDYDGVYDDMKEQELLRKKSRLAASGEGDEPNGRKKARYIQGIMQASVKRKIDLELAEERRIQREREEEGTVFADKEKFVTQSYLQRQKELRLMEEEEKKMEANSMGNATLFYKGILEETSGLRGGLVLPTKKKIHSESQAQEKQEEKEVNPQVKSQLQMAIDQGKVVVNDSMEIVDKRQLLSGGLNIPTKSTKRQSEQQNSHEQGQTQRGLGRNDYRQEMNRKRLALEKKNQELLQQKELISRQKELEKEKVKQELIQSSHSQVSQATVLDAKARYLLRKNQESQEQD